MPLYQTIDGLPVPLFYDPKIVRTAMEYLPGDDDIIVSSFPKCGASFVSQIVQLILKNGQQCYSTDEFFSSVPILELMGTETVHNLPSPRCLKTYLPLDRIEYKKHSKYIYVARHFSECVVSYYRHIRMFPVYLFTDGTIDEFVSLFIKGEVCYGDYISHFSSGYSKRWYDNVLFITYELLTLNLKDAILQIAGFLGEKHVRNLKRCGEKVLKDILFLNSSFMKSTVDDFWREMFLEKLLAGKCDLHFPVADKYARMVKEAESKGHFLNDVPDDITLSEENIEKLEKYFKDRVWIEGSAIWNYFMKIDINC
ncbi:sulfotransferase ssu-1-like [Parasteatoda tepidariorum]|uniref:sulfotransferase ssu-1-like n=1 Tax=Parasteatoda tepidariorum TaxID=114398 RepID=UPI001C722830|nr:sulfotransferase ssu-1-like isoform X2 [Parasteatoda tepidariorum]XP_015907675.2 sulfotransferase ssu-1-like isoform X2 [Parasteatoda tepidariorum]